MAADPTLPAMLVRAATPSDAEAIERIRIRGWQVGYRHLYPPRELEALELDWSRWTHRIESPPAGWATYVAEAHGRTVGFASVGPSRDEAAVGELYAIYVDPDEWSRGAGRALIARAEERLAA